MPKNKGALIRYRVINRCLLDNKYVTREKLVKACEDAMDIRPIGERTIEADIHAMRHDTRLGYFAPIGMEKGRGYFYEDDDYSIDNIPLNREELDSIVFASKLLEQYRGVDILRRFTGSVQKLVDALKVYRLNEEDSEMDYIELEGVEEDRGRKYMDALIEALRNRQVLKIGYRSFTSQKDITHIIHPYLLKEYRNRWYLVGYNEKYEGIRTYALDRFVSLQEEPSVAYTDTGFDAARYYENVVGISVLEEDPVDVEIAFTEMQAQYVNTQPLHKSQQYVGKEDDRHVFKYKLVPNYEFVSQILGWREEAMVLRPESLRKEILGISKRIQAMYS